MIEQEKQLLLKDLCGRLPYGVKCATEFGDSEVVNVDMEDSSIFVSCVEWVYKFKPYLRPMSSMTEEEKKEYELLANHCIVTSVGFVHIESQTLIDWINSHHFDYRGLIDKGLALEAPEGMYNLKN